MTKRSLWVGALLGALVASAGWAYASRAAEPAPKITFDDYLEIQQLYYKYAYAVDGLFMVDAKTPASGEMYADTYTDDGELNVVGVHDKNPIRGRQALIEFAKRGLANGPRKERHVVTNLLVKPVPGGAIGESHMMLVNSSTSPAQLLSNRATADILVKTPKGWRFKKRTNSLISTNTPF